MASSANSARENSSVTVRKASERDAEALTHLINAAFVVERVVFEGDRVEANEVRVYLRKGTFLLAEESGRLIACVYVEVREARGYLGLLSVDPPRQGSGLGRQLVAAAEDFARQTGARSMDLRVISARAELLPFYQRFGYEQTGTAPFAPGLKTKIPSHYILMSKPLQ
jgi:N-acetylglutamate synthase-like GNAT family acetyltransferase